ncbi:MAG TPA: glycosyltransferase, partial [Deltaproteobacteria bacterium]|nr:glycosyltransferase [Deltaproteobacteria bacterium]
VRNYFSQETIKDTGCGLKIMRATYLKRIKMFKGMHRFLPTLMKLEGARVIEVPVSHRPRIAGVTKYGTWERAFGGLRDLLAVRWMKDRFIRYEIGESNASDR